MTEFTFDKVIRPSSLTTYADCPRRWAARHMTALVQTFGYTLRHNPGSAGAAVGSGVHAANAYSLTQKMQTGGDLGAEKDALDAGIAEFDARLQQDDVAWDHTTNSRRTGQEQIRRMSYVYRQAVAPKVEPVLVEERVEADVGDGWVVSGQLDTLTQSPGDLRDTKTGTAQRSNSLQYGTYAMLFGSHGYEINRVIEDFIPRVDIRKEQPWPVEMSVPLREATYEAWMVIEALKRDTDKFVEMAQSTDSPPPHLAFRANPASTLCSDRWCPAWGTDFCKAHKGATDS